MWGQKFCLYCSCVSTYTALNVSCLNVFAHNVYLGNKLTDVSSPLFTMTKPEKLIVEGFSTTVLIKSLTCEK